MKKDILQQISELTDATYRADLARLKTLKEAEQGVRDALEELEKVSKRNSTALLIEMKGQKSLGGDVLWQAWMSRARGARQLEMAQIRVQKEHVLQNLRESFGRNLAARELKDTHASYVQKKHSKKCQAEQEDLNTLNAIIKR